MKKELKQFAVAAFDKIVGPTLDEFGSDWQYTNPTKWIIIDRKTRETIGKGQVISGDGASCLTNFDKPTKLRSDVKEKLSRKLGIK